MSIYFIQCGTNGPIKIGYTNKDVKERLSQLQTACPYELKLLWVTDGDQEDEQKMHESLKHENIRGEWFRPGKDVLAAVRDSDNEYIVEMNNYENIDIYENYGGTVYLASSLGDILFDLKNKEIKVYANKDAGVVVL